MYAYCSQLSQRLDNFRFEDKWETLEDLKLHGVLKRGSAPEMDSIVLNGVVPELIVPLGPKSVSCSHDVPMYWDQAQVKAEAEGTLVLEPRQ